MTPGATHARFRRSTAARLHLTAGAADAGQARRYFCRLNITHGTVIVPESLPKYRGTVLMRHRSLTYQEAAVAWLPNLIHNHCSPYAWWILVTGVMLALCLYSIWTADTRMLKPGALFWLEAGIVISGIATAYEIVGIIWGARAWDKIEPRLSEIFELTGSDHSTMRARMRRVWHSPAVLAVGSFGAILAWSITSVIIGTALGNSLPAYLLPVWFAFGCFWCAAAMYHIATVSWALYELSRHRVRQTFIDAKGVGVGEIGRLAIHYFVVYAIAAMLWSAAMLALPTGMTYLMLWVLGLLASALGLTLFLVPQLSLRRAIVQRKREALTRLLDSIESKYEFLTGHANESRVLKTSVELVELYRFLIGLPSSPFNLAGFSRLGATALLPLLPQLASHAVRHFLPELGWLLG